MDIYDQATAREERDRAIASSVRKPEGPATTGFCLNCAAPLGAGVRWCDGECMVDWQARQK